MAHPPLSAGPVVQCHSPPPRCPPVPAVHHVAANVDSSTGPLMPVLLALGVGFLGCVALAELWDDIQDDDDA